MALFQYLNSTNILDPSSMVSHLSFLSNMLAATGSLSKACYDGWIAHNAFMDFAKAFDKGSHILLLHNFKRYGAFGPVVEILGSFPTYRICLANERQASLQSKLATMFYHNSWCWDRSCFRMDRPVFLNSSPSGSLFLRTTTTTP